MTAVLTSFGELPAVQLTAPDGAQATITLYGAHLVSWKSADGRERLFCSTRSALDGSGPIRGGVPVIFPQFAARGTGMRHGFARVSRWRLAASGAGDGETFALFALTDCDLAPQTAAAWPHAFALELRIAVRANELRMSLDVVNTGTAPFSFAAALHTYYLVDQIGQVSIKGVQQGALAIDDKLDRIYRDVDGPITLSAGSCTLHLKHTGFTDAVVWNPGAADGAALADLGEGEYRRFVCIEPALVDPIPLGAGERWHGAALVHAGHDE